MENMSEMYLSLSSTGSKKVGNLQAKGVNVQNHRITEYRITELLGLEGTLKII